MVGVLNVFLFAQCFSLCTSLHIFVFPFPCILFHQVDTFLENLSGTTKIDPQTDLFKGILSQCTLGELTVTVPELE